jgi:hypothetical protein
VRTVLGLSKTSTSIGWVLVAGCDVAGDPLDHDSFDITDASTAAPAATARRVRDIATASGYTVDSVHVTSSGNLSSLRDALTESGFGDVVAVSLTQATRAWAMDIGYANDQRSTAVCILGRDSASLSVVDTSTGAIQVATTTASRDCVGLSVWLNSCFAKNESYPDALYLIGSRSQLAALADPLDNSLPVPVVATRYAQLSLAHGAATARAGHLDRVEAVNRSGFASHARTLTVVAAVAVVSLFTLSSAGSPISLAEKSVAASAPPPAAQPDSVPPPAAPVAPPVALLPAPIAEAQPLPEELPPAPIPEQTPVTAEAVAPEEIPVGVPQTADAAPPVEHLPDVQPVEHMPDTQAVVAPGPVAPEPAPPPPPDPEAGVLSPVFGSLG